ncbi:unnamed protein product [Boreogadus saida]
MIDLSHLTDEEQERIMKVLNRDTELKRHEEERVSKLQKLLDRGKQSETKLKYLTGEWFYEAKSRRHKDRIHGSEIILASMKQSNVDLTLSTAEASVKPSLSSPRASHSLAPPPKPARLLDTPLLVKKRVLDAESNQTQAASQSPGRPRRNPFNRASFIVVEPNEKTEEPIVTGDQRPQKSPDTEPMAPLKDPTACHSTPGGSLTSEASSTGFRPVPKMRTFASRRSSTLSNNAPGHDLPGDTKVKVPAPRLSLKYASQSVVASPSSDRSVESPAQGTEASQVSRFSPRVVAAKSLQRPTEELRKEEPAEDLTKNIPSVTPETNITSTKRDGPNAIGRVSPKKTRDAKPKEYGDSVTTSLSTNETKEPERRKVSNGGSYSASAPRDEDLSMTQSVVDQPVRYDLNLIEKAYQHTAPSSVPKPKLSHQISTPSEGEEGSIAKVLEWFSRSTDSNDWLNIEDGQPTVINLDRKEDVKDVKEDRMRDNDGSHVVEMKKDHLVKESNEVKENMEKKRESRVVREDVKKNARQEAEALSIEDKGDGNLAGKISNAKLPGPKILNIISDRAIGQHKDNRIELKENPREEETSTKLQSNVGKKIQSPKARTDSFGNISSRTSAMRRSTSMFSLNVSKEQDCGKKSQEGVMRQSADKSQHRRQSDGRVSSTRRPSVNSESQALRARAFVPRDYRHYLGMTEKSSVHNSLAPVVSEQGSDGKAYDFDLYGPARETSPVGSEERYGRTGGKASQRVNNSSSDTGRESSLSSTASETRSNSRTSSNWENDSEDQNPVKRALRRAELKNKTKSLEDITSFGSSTWQERRPDPSVMRRSKNATSISTASTASFSDPDHMKNMSKSVPSFLQKERSGSVMTMYSGDFGNVDVTGNIQFSINYVQKLTEFHIFVAQCQGLAAVDPKRGRSDPYVKSYLVPDKASLGKRKTAVKKKTLNPTFNEILRYRVHKEYLRTQTLILSVWHHDTFGKNSFLGEVDLDLSTWDFDHTQMNYLDLRARMPSSVTPSDNRGEMRLAIRFLPQVTTTVMMHGPPTGEVHIWVKECNNLPLIRATMDPYVKCFVLPDTSRKGRQKTRVLRRTTNPIFNHTMVYDGIKQADLTEACVELTVWDRDRLASNLLGGLRLGLGTGRSYGAVVNWMDSSLCEVRLWERMMASPNEWVEELLPLRRLTSAKTALK